MDEPEPKTSQTNIAYYRAHAMCYHRHPGHWAVLVNERFDEAIEYLDTNWPAADYSFSQFLGGAVGGDQTFVVMLYDPNELSAERVWRTLGDFHCASGDELNRLRLRRFIEGGKTILHLHLDDRDQILSTVMLIRIDEACCWKQSCDTTATADDLNCIH